MRTFRAMAIGVLRQHIRCGDAYPEEGWPEVNAAIAQYKLEKHMAPKPKRFTTPFLTLLTPAQHAALSAAAAAEGVSMGDVIRDALDSWLLDAYGPVSIEVSAVSDDGAEDDENLRELPY